ncbi:hypothetical protein COT87_01730 [Candidatus Collierbacteria bacterium CG10_big_fil_rev_8_21_14_0_10_44_9]|uniref:Glycosyl transferase family 1 domain-containing protein n=1 Tax=Candidatus Collierbacteria bacterium CG10_big_fil_rev_8_21_14_0_10_44_9 TaxID=1974535 RepID=A0A2H0VIS7_9BACT|nr:MAG: hypothetical protein COT87_01730 [Candidatus Collierbacteria bacterium CG10_big_fil_rev_8_21_14_0_10_44_9]
MPTVTHQDIPEDLSFRRTAHEERHLLETVEVPIVTVSATFKKELEAEFGEKIPEDSPDVTFSRAHYSMANAVVVAATKKKKTFWMIDPTNYVSAKDWPKIMFTERMGHLIARSPLLKELKDMIDTRLRNQLPLTTAIREPLTYVTARVKRPIISLHYEAGNTLLENGKTVLQVVTDPHVRPQYLTHADNHKLTWAVFDEKTKARIIELGFILGHKIDEKRVTVTGCPVDPRIILKDKNTAITGYKHRPLRLAITTGGLGTNKGEIESLLTNLAPAIKKGAIHIAAYSGVHEDFLTMFTTFARVHHIKLGELNDPQSPFRVFHGNDIVDANELLLDYVFPWADGFITKPSGDMAYEAIAAGCFLLTLHPWGEWEENIRAVTEGMGVSIRADIENITAQFQAITTVPVEKNKPWVELALTRAQHHAKSISQGAFNILKLHKKLS